MAFIRRKDTGGYFLVESYREGGRVKQRVLASLGQSPTLAEAAAEWRERAKQYEQRANKARHIAQKRRQQAAGARQEPLEYHQSAWWYDRCAKRAEARAVREERLVDKALAKAARFEALIPQYGHLEAPGAAEISAERQGRARALEDLAQMLERQMEL
jgi:hypothetical protein